MRCRTVLASGLALGLLFLAAPARAQTRGTGTSATATSASATLVVEPAEVEIGQPVVLTLEVTHARGRKLLTEPALTLDDSFVVTDGPAVTRARGAESDATVARWSLFSLEPGVRELSLSPLRFGDGETLVATPVSLSVSGELEPDEDAPRPMPGFHTVEERTSPVRPIHLGLLFALVVVAFGGWWFARRSRRGDDVLAPSALERFQHLDRDNVDDPAKVRALMYELSGLLRDAAERPLEGDYAAMSDEEWLAAVRATGVHPAATADELEVLLDECSRVKFAGVQPTRFAVDDYLKRADALLRQLDSATRSSEGADASTGGEV